MAAPRNTRPGIDRARQIGQAGTSPIQRAQAFVGKDAPVLPTPEMPVKGTTSPVKYGGPIGCFVAGADDWGEAKLKNAQIKRSNPNQAPPFIYYNDEVTSTSTGEPELTAVACPNPEYIREIPPPPPKPDPEAPITEKTESIITTEVDKIIEDSREVVKEVETKQDPVRPPVIITQDEVVPPPPITPTEILLENQANCEKETELPSINIVNEFNPAVNIDLSADATASVAPIVVEEPVRGCTDPDAFNYNPLASIDDGSCVFEPEPEPEPETPEVPFTPVDMPPIVPFVNSHGETVFEVEKEDVEQTENTDDDAILKLDSGQEVLVNLQLVTNITRPVLDDSDLVKTEVEKEVAEKVAARNAVGGELAGDSKLASDQDIVILGDKESLKDKIVRNNRGVIVLSIDKNPKLEISLRSQSFTYNQYKNTIDTGFSELIGKL